MRKIAFAVLLSFVMISAFQVNIFAKEEIAFSEQKLAEEVADGSQAKQESLPEENIEPEATLMTTTTTTSGGQPYQSTEKFQVEPSTGTASVNIPIEVPAGRSGIQPSLSLMYNSSSPNGILGVGWNLELGSIQRSTKRGVPTYNDSQDIFVLTQSGSSQELVPIGGNQYRAKIEGTFMKFEYQGSSNGWIVTDKKGIKYYFGQNSSSQQSGSGMIFKWCLDKVEDLSGNYMTITYSKNQNQIYPQRIYYTGNSFAGDSTFADIEFSWEQTRNDITSSYRSGFAVITEWRLQYINIIADTLLQRTYRFHYEYSPSSGRSLLTSITQYGADGTTSLPSTTFNYQTISSNFNLASGWNIPQELQFGHWRSSRGFFVDEGVRLADVNGDGLTDAIRYKTSSEKGVYINRGSGWFLDPSWNLPPNSPIEMRFVGDRDCYIADHGVRLADINGDGFIDMVRHFHATCPENIYNLVYLNNKSNGWYLSSLTMPSGTHFITDHSCGGACVGWQQNMGVLLEDINADGFTDVIEAGDHRRCFINNNGTGWTETAVFAPPSDVTFTDGNWTLADVNGDGLPDIVKATREGVYKTYLNNGAGWVDSPAWYMTEGNFERSKTQLVDINSDGLADIVVANESGQRVLINNGNGWTYNAAWSSSLSSNSIDLTDSRTRLLDANGDGLIDLMRHYNFEGGKLYLNDGASSNNFTDLLSGIDNGIGATTSINYTPSTQYDNKGSDSISDLSFPIQTVSSVTVIDQVSSQRYTTHYEYKNGVFDFSEREFRGFGSVKTSQGNNLTTNYNPSFESWSQGSNKAPDGWTIIGAVERSDSVKKEGLYSAAVTDTGYGSYLYRRLPLEVFGGKSIALGAWVKASLPNQARICICTCGGWYYSDFHSGSGEWEFLTLPLYIEEASPCLRVHLFVDQPGTVYFDGVKIIESNSFSDYGYSETEFLQDNIYKGRVKENRSYDVLGNLYDKTVNTWQNQDLSNGSRFVYLGRTDNYLYNGDSSYKQTATQYQYDNYGNPLKVSELGDVSQSGDERYSYTEYIYNESNWLLGLPKTTYLKDSSDSNIIKQSWFYYDGHQNLTDLPTKGFLTKQEDWLQGGTNPTARFVYDDYGNLLTTIDALGHSSSVTYDTDYHIFPLTATNALGHQVINEYYGVNGVALDDGTYRGLWGQLKSTTDPNNHAGFSIYDTFGRTLKQISPEDSIEYPTSSVEYYLNSVPIKIISHQREISGQDGTIDSVSFYDGLGRLIQTKTESEEADKFIVSGQTEYDYRGLPSKKYLPKFTNNPIDTIDPIDPSGPHSTISYDAMGRVVKSTNPDGTYSSVIYDDWVTTAIDENGHKQKSYVDAYGRLVKREEFTGADGRSPNYPTTPYALYATTQYSYDAMGNLTQTKDAHNNIVAIQYDTLGRKVSMDDPDMGAWSYQYDALGNLSAQTDAKGKITNFAYDNLNRLTQKTFSDGTLPVNYTYDDAAVPNSKGRLTKANYQLTANTNFVYDELGREVKSTKKIESSDYEVQRSYDAAGRLLSVKYPDNESVFYSYNRSGQVEQVAGSPIATDTQTKLLLHVDGADGSTSFRDDSLANHSIAAFGNVQLDTSQSKFGGSSALFDGNGDYLSISDSSNWNFGSEDFTIDFWARFESLSGDPKMIIHQQDYDTTTWYVMYYPPTHAVHFLFLKDNVAELSLYKELELSLATWYHFAFVKSGTTAYMFINGSLIMSDSCSASLNNFSSNLAIGSHVFGTMMFFDGELDEFRISKGIARWTSNFTPPNEPYSIVSGDVQYYVSNVDYNASGQITRIEYGNGDITEYTYDPLNLRLTHLVTTSPASGIIQDLSYQYDSAGNILQIIDNVNTGSQTFQYDELSRLVVASGSYGTEYFDYDEIGNITLKDGVIYSYGAGLAGPHAVTSGSDGSIFSYDANGNMVSMTKGSINTRYEYDAENRLKSVIKNNQALASFAYDGDGGRTKKTLYKYSGGGGCFLAGTPILMADGSTKPIEKVKVGDEVLSFDENKNLLVADTVKQAFIHKANEYFILNGSLRVTGEHPFYSNGEWIKVNELKIGDSIKDKEGNLKKITDIQKVKADVLVYNLEVNPYHTYFADGFLVHNKLPMRMFNDTGSGDNYGILENEKPSQLRYVFEFLSSLLEPTVAEAATVTEIPTIFVGSLYEKTSGSPTKHIFLGSQRIASITNSQVNYYHTDHLGSTNVITNEAGNQIALYEYKPYGEFSRKEEASADPTEYFFTGKKLDDETGLYYYGARYYNPLIGRFITPDTIVQAPANPQSLNRYAYCGNNPINVIDPTGHWSWKKFWHSFAGAFVGAVVTVLTAGWGAPLWLAGMAGGFFGGALTGGLEGGGMGALYGGLIGGALGGLGGWGLGIAQSHQMAGQYAAGLLIVGAGTSAASDNWDRFAGGLAGGIAGAIVGNGIDSYFHEGISSRTTQSTDSAMQEQAQRNVRMLGIGTTDQKAQAAANAKNATVFYTKSRGYASDFVRAGIQKVFHNSLASRQFAANYLRGASNINIYAHSEGTLTLAGAIKSLNVDGVKVIGVNIDFRGPVIMESTARTLATSIGATYTYQLNIGDPVGIFATVNPVMLGLYGAIGIPTLATFHSTDYY